MLVHEDRPEIAAVADALWYPIWDAGVRLDHSVRSVPEAVAVASTDVKAGLGLLDVRLVAGDADLAAPAPDGDPGQLAAGGLPAAAAAARPAPRAGPPARASWPSCSSPTSRRPTAACARGRCCGRSPRPSSATSPAPSSRRPTRFLLDVRDELRRRSGRPTDVLVRQEQRPVADALGLADEDALLREVSLAGRRLAFVADETWRRVEAALVRRPRGRYRRVRREPLAEGVVRQGDEVVLARDAQAGRRSRAAAARRGRRGAGGPAALALHAQGARGAQPAGAGAVAGRGPLVVPAAAGQRAGRRRRCWSSWTRRACCPG